MMGKVIMSGIVPQLEYEAPVKGIALSTLAEGSIVKLNENGSPVEFYVAKHDYESGLNGAGRTLLVRKEGHSQQKWHTASTPNAYASCFLDSWFNSTYKALLDADVQEAIGTTTFYYTPGNYTTAVSTLARAVFALSVTELGSQRSNANTEGSALPIASTLAPTSYISGVSFSQWTRTPYNSGNGSACVQAEGGGNASTASITSTYYVRPCFTLPATALFDEETLILKGVA